MPEWSDDPQIRIARLLDRLDMIDRWASYVVALCSSQPLQAPHPVGAP